MDTPTTETTVAIQHKMFITYDFIIRNTEQAWNATYSNRLGGFAAEVARTIGLLNSWIIVSTNPIAHAHKAVYEGEAYMTNRYWYRIEHSKFPMTAFLLCETALKELFGCIPQCLYIQKTSYTTKK